MTSDVGSVGSGAGSVAATSTASTIGGQFSMTLTDGAVFVVYRQPISLDRFTVTDVRPRDATGELCFEIGVNKSLNASQIGTASSSA
jgi:hypothetical protein